MKSNERLELLKQLLTTAGGKIEGRTKLHKLAYLCQEKGTDLGQDFTFHLYGVFSPTLEFDISMAEQQKVLREDEGRRGMITTTLTKSNAFSRLGRTVPKEAGFELVDRLKSEPSPVLEVLSTIVYLKQHDYDGDRLKAKLKELKGHLSKYEGNAWALANREFGIVVG